MEDDDFKSAVAGGAAAAAGAEKLSAMAIDSGIVVGASPLDDDASLEDDGIGGVAGPQSDSDSPRTIGQVSDGAETSQSTVVMEDDDYKYPRISSGRRGSRVQAGKNIECPARSRERRWQLAIGSELNGRRCARGRRLSAGGAGK